MERASRDPKPSSSILANRVKRLVAKPGISRACDRYAEFKRGRPVIVDGVLYPSRAAVAQAFNAPGFLVHEVKVGRWIRAGWACIRGRVVHVFEGRGVA